MNALQVNSGDNRWRRFIYCGKRFPVTLLLLLLLGFGCSEKEQAQSRPDVPVSVAEAALQDVPNEIAAIGTVEAYSTVNITSRIDGQVMEIHVKEGMFVEKGQLLFTIDERPYRADMEFAAATLARDRIQLEKAGKDAARYAELFAKDYVTKDQAEQAQATAAALAQMVKGDEAAVESARLNVAYCRIMAPVSGRAGSILINEGNLVKANDNTKSLMTINRIQPIYVRFSLPEQRLSEIQRRFSAGELTVKASLPGLPDEPKTGRLTFVDNTIDPDTGTIDLKAEFENRDKGLWPGQFVNVVLMLGLDSQVVVVPSAAVQMGQNGYYLFLVQKDNTVASRDVIPGIQVNGYTVVEKGLSAGERVVTDGQLRLFPGAKVAVKTAAQPGTEEQP